MFYKGDKFFQFVNVLKHSTVPVCDQCNYHVQYDSRMSQCNTEQHIITMLFILFDLPCKYTNHSIPCVQRIPKILVILAILRNEEMYFTILDKRDLA